MSKNGLKLNVHPIVEMPGEEILMRLVMRVLSDARLELNNKTRVPAEEVVRAAHAITNTRTGIKPNSLTTAAGWLLAEAVRMEKDNDCKTFTVIPPGMLGESGEMVATHACPAKRKRASRKKVSAI